MLNDKRVIPKERKTVRAIKLIRAADLPGQIIRAKLAMNKTTNAFMTHNTLLKATCEKICLVIETIDIF